MKTFKFLLMASTALLTVNFVSAQTWTPTSAPWGFWFSIASSADGSKLVAYYNYANGLGPIFNSTNSGMTWTSNNTVLDDQLWHSIASSADGNKLAALALWGQIYTSTNSGATWRSNSLPPALSTSIASSADGTKLIAVASNNLIYTSTDSGATWTSNSTVMDTQPWHSVASSADGSKLAIAADPGTIYISTNSGTTWRIMVGAPGTNWEAIVSSADGTKLAAIARSGLVYTSPDSGVTWTSNSLPIAQWTSIASSADGRTLVAAACSSDIYYLNGNGSIYISTNSGTTWTLNATGHGWGFVASSADGSKLVALIGDGVVQGLLSTHYGGIYTSQTTLSPRLNLTPATTNLTLAWTVPSTNFVMQQNLDLTTTNWIDVTNPPVLNLTNLQNEVTLPMSSGSGFYRLKTP